MADSLRDLIAETLAEHRKLPGLLQCICGHRVPYGGGAHKERSEYERHVAEADVLLAALGDRALAAKIAGGEPR